MRAWRLGTPYPTGGASGPDAGAFTPPTEEEYVAAQMAEQLIKAEALQQAGAQQPQPQQPVPPKPEAPAAPQYQVPVATLTNPYARYGTWSDVPMGPYQYGMPQTQQQAPQQVQYAYAGAPGGVTTIEYLPGAVAPYSTPYAGGTILDLSFQTGQSPEGRSSLREAEKQIEQYKQSLTEQVAGAYPTIDLVASGGPAQYPMYAPGQASVTEEAVVTEQAPVPVLPGAPAPAPEGLGSKWIWIAVAGVAAYLFTRGGRKKEA